MCLPRALVSDEKQPAMFHRVAKIESLAWSRKPPSARAVRLIYSPRTPAARADASSRAAANASRRFERPDASNAFAEFPSHEPRSASASRRL